MGLGRDGGRDGQAESRFGNGQQVDDDDDGGGDGGDDEDEVEVDLDDGCDDGQEW